MKYLWTEDTSAGLHFWKDEKMKMLIQSECVQEVIRKAKIKIGAFTEYLGVMYDYLHTKLYGFHVIQVDETLVSL